MRINGRTLFTVFALLLCFLTAAGFLLVSNKTNSKNGLALAFFPSAEKQPLVLTSEELADLVKPAVVRIATHFSGEVEVVPFDLNLTKLTFSFPHGKPLKVPIDQTILGSGFVVNSNGYVLTNAHVVSDTSIKNSITADIILRMIYLRAQGLTKAQADKIINTGSDAYVKFDEDLLKQVVDKSTFTIKKEITVLNPSSKKDNLKDFITDGFPAASVKINDNFVSDNKDIGLIKIDQQNLPSVKLAGDEYLAVGDKINFFGFPSSADFNQQSLLEPTFTQGVVSALKDSDNKDFKIFQTDAKISPGSSGGPLFNAKGEIAGLVTYQSDSSKPSQQGGDNFAFAIPIKIAKEIIAGATEINSAEGFTTHFVTGLELLQNHSCKSALTEFNAASKTNSAFNVDKFVSPYVEKCANLISSGQSIDNWWDAFRAGFKNVSPTTWMFVGGGIAILAIFIFLMMFLIKQTRKEEKKIDDLELKIDGKKTMDDIVRTNVGAFIPRSGQPNPSKLFEPGALPTFAGMGKDTEKIFKDEKPKKIIEAKPNPPNADPALINYVKEARAAQMTDSVIKEELKKVGWPKEAIIAALNPGSN